MQHYNSSISQSFMVMSFVAAGLLLSVQLTGDRDDDGRSMTARAGVSPTSVASRTISRRLGSTRYIPPETTTVATSATSRDSLDSSQSASSQPNLSEPNLSEPQWVQSVQASLSPISFIHALMATPKLLTMPERAKDSTIVANINAQNNSETGELISSFTGAQWQSNATGNELASATGNELANLTGNELASETGNELADDATSKEQGRPLEGSQQEQMPAALAQLDVASIEHHSTSDLTENFNTVRPDVKQQATNQQETIQQKTVQQGVTTARLVVDLSDRQLTFYEQNEQVKTYSIAVGKVGWETPLGEFTVTDMDPEPLWQHPLTGELVPAGVDSPLGSRWIGFWSDGIHRIGFHGTNQAQSIGQAISHGCIRLHDSDIQELYSQIPLGTTVIVQP